MDSSTINDVLLKMLNSQISPQRFVENTNKLSMFYCININPQCIIFLKLKPKTFKKHKNISISIKSNVKYAIKCLIIFFFKC